MMNEIQIFNSEEFGEIRTVMIDGEPWFVAKDVAIILNYKDTASAARRNVDIEDKRGGLVDTPSGKQEMLMVNESGLYSLIFGSKLESAKRFKKWVTSEVLPQIRKTGTYGKPQIPMTTQEQIQLLAQGSVELTKKVDTLAERMDKIELDLPILPIEAERITEAVKRKGVSSLKGKKSAAYADRSLRQKVYHNIYANLKYNFGIKSYKAIQRSQCDRAIEIINKWEPPVFLAYLIDEANAQMGMNL